MLHFAADGDFLRYTLGSTPGLKDKAEADTSRQQENYYRAKPVLTWQAASCAQKCVIICERLFRAGSLKHADSEVQGRLFAMTPAHRSSCKEVSALGFKH